MPAAEELLESNAEVLIDPSKGFLELLARDLVDLANRGNCVLDGGDQIFALAIEERVTFGSLAILFERHHVHRTHGFQFRAHLAMKLVTSSRIVARDERECRIGQQSGALDSQFV